MTVVEMQRIYVYKKKLSEKYVSFEWNSQNEILKKRVLQYNIVQSSHNDGNYSAQNIL